ncbi:tyrosinase cofactor [Streptomyces chryseus]|uniref:Tyrosinase n=1 Tax=Streptomyces chryseus TaxID=68186 RepID=A0ABQ3DSK5_9ACTN|nr:tyrosinase cofactor [Streptomyces chryseus]GGX24238.1 tyrosinase [Streptomyces chryseus]GHB04059.1 tyrosinase [Streptomyces chryseus]
MGLSTRRSAATARGGSLTRRILLRGAFAMGMIAGTAGALAPILGKRAAEAPGTADGPAAAGTAKAPGTEPERYAERFAETYRGRHIQGTARGTRPARAAAARRVAAGDAMTVTAVRDVEVRIDGRPLHVMRRADGSYLSLVNHYESFPTLLDAARAAVDELGGAQLSTSPLHRL